MSERRKTWAENAEEFDRAWCHLRDEIIRGTRLDICVEWLNSKLLWLSRKFGRSAG